MAPSLPIDHFLANDRRLHDYIFLEKHSGEMSNVVVENAEAYVD
jgi:hypothetical protein